MSEQHNHFMKRAADDRRAELVGSGALMLGGGALARSGMRDVDFANHSSAIFDDSTRRLKTFSQLDAPTNTRAAGSAYKDLADSFEQLSRHSDDLIDRHSKIIDMAGGRFGIAKDSLRQSLTRSLLRILSPNSDLGHAAIGDTTKDVIGRVRAAGFADYDKGQDIIKQFKPMQQEARAGLELAGRAAPHVNKLTNIIRTMGKAKTGVGALAAIGGGAWMMSRPTAKQAAFSEAATDASAAMSPLSALLMASGIRDVAATPKDVLISYGTDDRLGAGHASPGRNIAKIIQEDPRFRAHGVNAVEAPATQGLMSTSNPGALKGRYAMGVDTGWGVMDDHYGKQWGSRDFPTGGSLYRDAVIETPGVLGGRRMTSGTNILDRVGRVVKFHPDAPSTVSGNSYADLTHGKEPAGISGLLSRILTRKGKYHNLTYGDGSGYDGKNLNFVGAAHPAANIDVSPALDRDAYRRLVAEELAISNKGTTVDDWLAKIGDRKIISVSGASRGDSVGARVAALHEAMGRSGDKHFIVGLGGKNKAAQQAIAAAAGISDADMGFAGFTSRFTPLAQNSDLHFMGMGGATPYEMMASAGGAPIVRALDEEVFDRVFDGKDSSPEGIKKWLDSTPRDDGRLNRGAGLAGRQIELAQRALAEGDITDPLVREALEEAASYNGGRDWMNPTRLVGPDGKQLVGAGEHSKLKRGLDGILDYLNGKKIRAVEFGDGGGSMDQLLSDFRDGKLNGLDDLARQGVHRDIAASKAGLADQIFKHWKSSRNQTRMVGAGKAALGAAALTPLLASIFGQKSQPASSLKKIASDTDWAGIAADSAMVGGGGLLLENGMQAVSSSGAMERLLSRAQGQDHWDPRRAAQLMDEYAVTGGSLMRSRPLLISNRALGGLFPPSEWHTVLTNPVAQTASLLEQVGAKRLAARMTARPDRAAALAKIRGGIQHYQGFADNPHQTLIEELDHRVRSYAPHTGLPASVNQEIRNSTTIGEALRAVERHGTGSARWQVGNFADNFLAPGRGPGVYGSLQRGLGRAGIAAGAATAAVGIGSLLQRQRAATSAPGITVPTASLAATAPAPPIAPSKLDGIMEALKSDTGRNLAIGGGVTAAALATYLMSRRRKREEPLLE